MNVEQLPDVLAGSIVLTGLYVLIGLSWVIIFRAAHLFNFATGELLVLSSFIVAALIGAGHSYWLSVLLGIVMMAVLGVAIYRFLLKPFAGQPVFTPVIVTLGLGFAIRGFIEIIFGSGSRRIDPPFDNTVHSLPGGITLTTFDLIVPCVALVFYLSLLVFLRATKFGGQMRAAHENPLLASQSGVSIYVVFSVAFVISMLAISLAGVSNGQRTIVTTSAVVLGLKGLVPAMLGGLDSVGGVLAGALIVALAETLTIYYIGAGFKDMVVFSILLLVLAFRTTRLFGSREIQRV